jgi:hypothetical protein
MLAAGCSAGAVPDGGADEGVDVDLTAMSATMVYAEVYNITVSPADYVGKTIKASGLYYPYYYEETGLIYHNIYIADAAACCQQGIEFAWQGEHAYPDDYPAEQARIVISGTFGSYDELGYTYYHIVTDGITVE